MEVRIYPSPLGYHLYDLWVNGKKKIEGESFAVVDNVRGSLLGQPGYILTEPAEIAENIRKAL